jgi:hypothetical protein
MKFNCLLLSLWGLIFCLQSSFADLEPTVSRSVFTDTTETFEFVARDERSVRFIMDLSASVEVVCRRLLGDDERRYPSLIFVTMRPEDEVEVDGDYKTTIGERGLVRVDYRWDTDLSLEVVCMGLAEGYLSRYIYFRRGPSAAATEVPAWLVAAIGRQTYLQLRPAMMVDYVKGLRAQSAPSLDLIIEGSDTSLSIKWGYWVLAGLRTERNSSKMFTQLAQVSLAGGDVVGLLNQSLAQSISPEESGPDAEVWWRAALEELRASSLSVYETLEDSRGWIELVASVRGLELEDGKQLKSLKDLWPNREVEAVRQIISARREILFIRINQVNPAYYNAALALVTFYENILNGTRRSDNITALIDFLGEMEDMKRLEAVVQKALK